MESEYFIDINDIIFKTLYSEWLESKAPFAAFIQEKQLGLMYTIGATNFYLDKKHYSIVDSKKWLLTRIKYGI